MSIITLQSGSIFDLLNPDSSSFTIEDIAHALGQTCRFNGHTKVFYSVAQHLVLCSYIVDKEHALGALLHDAHEAFVGDIVTPLKALLPDFKDLEIRIEKSVLNKFGLTYPLHPSIKQADLKMLATEKRDLLKRSDDNWPMLNGITPLDSIIIPHNPLEATFTFLERYYELIKA